MEAEDGKAWMVRLLQVVLGGLLTIDQIWVEHVELVALRGNRSKNRRVHKQGSRPAALVVSLHSSRRAGERALGRSYQVCEDGRSSACFACILPWHLPHQEQLGSDMRDNFAVVATEETATNTGGRLDTTSARWSNYI